MKRIFTRCKNTLALLLLLAVLAVLCPPCFQFAAQAGPFSSGEAQSSWLDEGNYDTAWFDPDSTEFFINNAIELAGFAYLLNDDRRLYDCNVTLTADVDMSAHQWPSDIEFYGNFDGRGHFISGLNVNTSASFSTAGFIGYLHYGTIKNVNIINSSITGSFAGAIAGRNDFGRIINCSARADIVGYVAGGIVGESSQHMESCIHNNYFVGTVRAPDDYPEADLGGIAGVVEKETIYNNYAKALGFENNYLNLLGYVNEYFVDPTLFENNFVYNGGGFRRDFDIAEYTTSAAMLSSLNEWVQAFAEENDDYSTYYAWKIEDGQNDNLPLFGDYYVPTLAVEAEISGIAGEFSQAYLGREYNAVLTAQLGFSLPDTITVTMAGAILNAEEFSYNPQNGELTIPAISGEVTIQASAIPNTDTQYTVEHYFEDIDGSFIKDGRMTQTFTGTTLTLVTSDPLSGTALSAGFLYNPDHTSSLSRGTIAGDGSLILKLYYARVRYTVTYKNGDTVLNTIQVAYGQTPVYGGEIPQKAADKNYTYTFAGWSPEVGAISSDTVFTAQFNEIKSPFNLGLIIIIAVAAAVLVAAIILLLTLRRTAIFIVNGSRKTVLKLRIMQKIDIPSDLQGYLWFTDPSLAVPFNQKRIGIKNITIHGKKIKTIYRRY